MNDPRTVREIAEDNQEQLRRVSGEIEVLKARLRLIERQLGWDPAALEFPADEAG